jgi:hypothetical protein
MKKLTFEVTVVFSSNIKDFELQEVTKNLTEGIERHIMQGYGIAPDESEACTKSFKVKETLSGIEHEVVIF